MQRILGYTHIKFNFAPPFAVALAHSGGPSVRKIFLAGIMFAALAAAMPVSAADLPAKIYTKAPPVTTAVNWTGCYVGVNAGYGWGHDVFSSGGTDEGDPNFRGGMGGGQVGCDYQFAASWVVGAEAIYDFASLRGNAVDPAVPTVTTSSKYSGIGSLTGRAGYTFDRSLIYLKGGFAWSRSDRTLVGIGFSQDTGTTSKSGWVIGGGWEYMFAPNWSAKIEYNHYYFGSFSESVTQLPGGAVFLQGDSNKNVDVVLVGLNFRFR
jgi:outer membrane immunogenic protein